MSTAESGKQFLSQISKVRSLILRTGTDSITAVILLGVTAGLLLLALSSCGSSLASLTGNTTSDPAPAVTDTPSATGTCSLQAASQPYDPNTNQYTAPTYTVTLTNTSTVPDDISQIAIVFYDTVGSEDGSDQQMTSGIIARGQSLSWSFTIPDSLIGSPVQTGTVTSANDGGAYWNDGDSLDVSPVIPATCQFVQWG